ncbi:hypothetical protein [Streptomyces yaizuensis]|uniref:Secreted protein n=1 Tax=Streptomyces yaizuensis TaxID=2989713 RepID=A0ABQ5P1M3_9ACTN|nr:hypothetical protein [Streptomyces sp. YSPA8]GLF96497.1 hypothetical protein SYYSPA8_19390 [Streptomyces sp. YSPA8]
MTKTQRAFAAVAFAAGASVFSIAGAFASPVPVPAAPAAPAPQGSAVEQLLTGVNELSQLHQLTTVTDVPGQVAAPATDQLAVLTDPVAGLAGAVQP